MLWPNDWTFNRFVVFITSVISLATALTFLSITGIPTYGTQQVIGFIFLTFIPGIILLRILRVHNLNIVESAVYSVGISLATVMLVGITFNYLLPQIQINQPFAPMPLTISFFLVNCILLLVAYFRDGQFRPTHIKKYHKLPLPALGAMVLLLSLTILGVVINNAFQNNIVLLICIPFICALIILAITNKLITPALYPFTIFILGLCLLYQTTLMSPYLIGTDIYLEYGVFKQVMRTGFWDHSITNTINMNVNSCLSISMLAPIYSILLNLDGIWVFKAVYPIIFSFMPLVLFRIYRIQIGPQRAFLAAIFFIMVPTFFLELISLCRQQVAEIFFALLLLLMVDTRLRLFPRLIMACLFASAIAVSHYSLGFISLMYLGLSLPLILLMRSDLFSRIWKWLTSRTGGLPPSFEAQRGNNEFLILIVTTFVVYFITAFTWFSIVSDGINLRFLLGIWQSLTGNLTNEIVNIFSNSLTQGNSPILGNQDIFIKAALGLDFTYVSDLGKVFRVIQIITQVFIVAGILRLIIKPIDIKCNIGYLAYSITSIIILAACILIPGFAGEFNMSRWYHVTLISLAPFFVLGAEVIANLIKYLYSVLIKTASKFSLTGSRQLAGQFVALFIMIPYFLFTSGWIYEVAGQDITGNVDTPYSIAFSSYRVDLMGVSNARDGAAAAWLSKNISKKNNTYSDMHSCKLFQIYGLPGTGEIIPLDGNFKSGSLILFSSWNMEQGTFTFAQSKRPGLRYYVKWGESPVMSQVLNNTNITYANGTAQIRGPTFPVNPSNTP